MKHLVSICTLVLLVFTASPAQTGKGIQITWLGHAAFEIVSPGGTRLLIDPYLTQNPATPAEFKDLSRYKPSAILLTHSHFEHSPDALALAMQSGAPVIGSFDYISSLPIPEGQKQGGNVGGKMTIGDVTIHLVPAMHGSEPAGRPLGFVFTFSDGRTIYDSGDTWIFGDMKWIQEFYHPNIILLCVGGGPFTEDPATAARAIKEYFSPQTIIPMHFGTFPALSNEADVKKAFPGDKRLTIMKPGETRTF